MIPAIYILAYNSLSLKQKVIILFLSSVTYFVSGGICGFYIYPPLISFAKVYSSDIKIGIFSKYSLSEISVETKEDARIFYAGKDTNLKKG